MTQLRVQHLLSGLSMMMVAGGGVKAGERLSLVTLAVNIEHDAVPHCSNAPGSYWAQEAGEDGEWKLGELFS